MMATGPIVEHLAMTATSTGAAGNDTSADTDTSAEHVSALTNIDTRGGSFDSRDIIDRIEELEAIEDRDDYDTAELAALRAFADYAAGYAPDWQYGAQFIHEDSFEDHARELAEDIGAIPDDASWPVSYIDWPAAAAALQQDYTSIEIDGDTWYVR